MKRFLKMVIILIMVSWLVWFGTSYVEVLSQNLTEVPQYSPWNLFELLVKN